MVADTRPGAGDPIRYALPSGYRGTGFPGQPFDRNPGAADRLPPGGPPDSRVERLTGVAYRLAWDLLRRLPEPVAYGLAAAAGELVHALVPGTRRQLRANLARVVPAAELKAATRRAMRSVTRSYVESFRAADLDPADLDRRTDVSGFREHVDAALNGGEGLIVLLAHHGSWDVAARWAETHGYHLGVVAEVLRPHELFRRFVRLREAMGMEVVPLPRAGDKGRDAVTRRLRQVLADNSMVGLLADRDLSGKAPVVQLFGEPCRMPAGPALLALRTGAPVIPITMLQLPGRRWHHVALPALDLTGLSLADACQRVAHGIEDLIRLDPTQWHALQPIFERDRE